jgi:SAM-dependent methyltransferase
MCALTNPELLRFLACPACAGDVADSADGLCCTRCGASYEIRHGIPLLYPSSVNTAHLLEEESLAQMMESRPASREEQFRRSQWSHSKQEFWAMVSTRIETPPRSLVNIGCGFDSSAVQLEQQGYDVVHFDMVHRMLDTLQTDRGARSCVAGDATRLPLKKSAFDYVVSVDLIHHESEAVPALLESFRDLLKPGGSLFLEDPNAWGVFQAAKSILLPKPLHRLLRSVYHRLKMSTHRPADYEFPTSVWRVRAILRDLGFKDITVYPNTAYPCIGQRLFWLWSLLSRFEFTRKYHNYHYMLSAVRS